MNKDEKEIKSLQKLCDILKNKDTKEYDYLYILVKFSNKEIKQLKEESMKAQTTPQAFIYEIVKEYLKKCEY